MGQAPYQSCWCSLTDSYNYVIYRHQNCFLRSAWLRLSSLLSNIGIQSMINYLVYESDVKQWRLVCVHQNLSLALCIKKRHLTPRMSLRKSSYKDLIKISFKSFLAKILDFFKKRFYFKTFWESHLKCNKTHNGILDGGQFLNLDCPSKNTQQISGVRHHRFPDRHLIHWTLSLFLFLPT